MAPPFTWKLKLVLEQKWISIFVAALAIGSRILQLVFFYNIRVDASYQVMATQNFVYGHGISTSHVLPTDLSTNIYQPLINWPPGYSLLLSPFFWLFEPNYIMAGIVLDIIAAITLILVSRAILRLFDIPVYLINIYTLFTGFFVYYFYFIASSDAIAISFFIVALYFTLSVLKAAGSNGTRQTVIITTCLLVCGFIKYLFIPIIFIIPVFLIAKGLSDHNERLKKAGLFCSCTLLIGITTLLVYQKCISGSAAYISQPERGFYPEHLLDAHPFTPSSFIKPDTLAMMFGQKQGLDIVILRTYQVLHLSLIFVAVVYIVQDLYKTRFKKSSFTKSYFYLLFLVSFTISFLLALLSVKVAKEEILPGWFWTYIEEPRYYGLLTVMIQLGVFVSYRHFHTRPSKKIKFVFYFLILLFLPEIFRGMIFDFNRLRFINKEEYSWQYEDRFQKYAAEIIKNQKQIDEKVVVTGSWYYMNHRVSIYSHAPILDDVHKINHVSSLNTKAPVLLLVILKKKDLSEFRPFFSEKKAAGRFEDYIFFTIHVTPL